MASCYNCGAKYRIATGRKKKLIAREQFAAVIGNDRIMKVTFLLLLWRLTLCLAWSEQITEADRELACRKAGNYDENAFYPDGGLLPPVIEYEDQDLRAFSAFTVSVLLKCG